MSYSRKVSEMDEVWIFLRSSFHWNQCSDPHSATLWICCFRVLMLTLSTLRKIGMDIGVLCDTMMGHGVLELNSLYRGFLCHSTATLKCIRLTSLTLHGVVLVYPYLTERRGVRQKRRCAWRFRSVSPKIMNISSCSFAPVG